MKEIIIRKSITNRERFLYGGYTFEDEMNFKETREKLRRKEFGVRRK
jgi:hypothetical protein